MRSRPIAVQRRINLALAFLGQNCALGLIYGTYGTILGSIEAEFRTSRATASGGMSALLLTLGLLSPVIGKLLQRFSIRSTMIAGALFSAAAYIMLALAPSIDVIFAGYALAGAGACMLGIIAPTTLISRWYQTGRGKALGIVNLPLFLFLTPMITATLLPATGLRGLFFVIATLYAMLAPFLLLIEDHPPQAARDPTAPGNCEPASTALPLRPIITAPSFWLVTLGVGILTGAGTSFSVHFVSLATSRGSTLSQAGVMLAGYGLAGLAGTYLFGWLADKIASHLVLCLNALVSACLWGLLLTASGFEAMLVIACLIGACTTALVALQGAAIGKMFGVAYVSSVMGITYFFKLPFIFGSAPLVGHLFDLTGGYAAGIVVHIVGFIIAAVAFAAIGIALQAGSNKPAAIQGRI